MKIKMSRGVGSASHSSPSDARPSESRTGGKKIYYAALIVAIIGLLLPSLSFAASVKTFSGTVSSISGSQIIFTTTSAATYSAETGSAQLVRKNGASMQLAEILVGDKLEVKGTLWGDNSISASYIQDKSLYAHNGTFSGKISSINPPSYSFTIESKANGAQVIYTNNFTSFSKNGANSAFNNLELGQTATVKGVWDRSNANVVAASVTVTFRLINIYFTGSLSAKNANALTIIGNGNVIYGVDVNGAQLLSKNGQPLNINDFKLGDTLRVWGKHLSGTVQITGTKVKDSSVTK